MSVIARNLKQAQRGKRALKAYARATGESPESARTLRDLLIDLMHSSQFTPAGPLDFDSILSEAREQYKREAAGVGV